MFFVLFLLGIQIAALLSDKAEHLLLFCVCQNRQFNLFFGKTFISSTHNLV
jgi:hypothetical protein